MQRTVKTTTVNVVALENGSPTVMTREFHTNDRKVIERAARKENLLIMWDTVTEAEKTYILDDEVFFRIALVKDENPGEENA